jgi:hypothetical protein
MSTLNNDVEMAAKQTVKSVYTYIQTLILP